LRVNIETGGVAACGGFNDFLWHHIPNATITKKMNFLVVLKMKSLCTQSIIELRNVKWY